MCHLDAEMLTILICTSSLYACTVKDLLLRGPVCNAVASCVHTSFTDDQCQTAYLLQECVVVRDGLANLPDCFTAGDMSSYQSTC